MAKDKENSCPGKQRFPRKRQWPRHSIDCSEGNLTEQNHADYCDINYVIRQYQATGTLPNNFRPGQYGAQPPSFHERQLLNADLNNYYESLPDTEKQNYNGVEDFKDMLLNPEREAEAVKFGLLEELEYSADPYDPNNPLNAPQEVVNEESADDKENKTLTEST
ncbi:internal scaffolding protein [Microviridae sp.]|nr:internal scaffolding protein [Microviridae sp.]